MLTLVTGATGLVGNNVVRRLVAQDRPVRVLLRANSDERSLADLSIERCVGDVTDAAAVARACQGVNIVIHAAARVHIGWSDLEEQRRVNVEGLANMAAAARAVGARLVHVSTVDTLAVGSPAEPADEERGFGPKSPSTYVASKREAEERLRGEIDRGLDAVIVQPSFMLGPWDWKPSSGRMLLRVARGGALAAPPGGISIADVRDVADGIVAAAARGATGRNYILAGHNMSLLDAWRRFAAIAGRRGPLFRLGWFTPWLIGQTVDLHTRLTGREGELNSAAVLTGRLWHTYSSARAQRELGYRQRPVEETIAAAWSWFREYGYVES